MSIVQKSDPVLHEKSRAIPVTDIPKKPTRDLIERMKRALRAEPSGVGLAAVQIGIPKAIFIVSKYALDPKTIQDIENEEETRKKKEAEQYLIFVNPHIVRYSRKKELVSEGCLSVRSIYGKLKRSTNVTVEAHDENGKKFTRGAGGLFAQVLQHEMDHLQGILFVDKALSLDRPIP